MKKNRKIITVLLSLVLLFFLAGCSKKPTEEKIKAALKDGTITTEDAKKKGWIDDEWIENNMEMVEAATKIHQFSPFETTYLDGTSVSQNIISGKMLVAFFDSATDKGMEQIDILNSVHEKFTELNIPILGVVLDKDLNKAKERLKDVKYPVIVFNDEMQTSLQQYDEMLQTDFISVWTKDGGFYTAWKSTVNAEDLISYAESHDNEE